MDKRLLTCQPELKQTSRIQNNETRPTLMRSKSYIDNKKLTANTNNLGGSNKANRLNNRQSDNRNKGTKGEGEGDASVGDDEKTLRNKPNRRINDKAELNNEDIGDEEELLKKKKGNSNLNHLLNFKFLRQEPYHVYEREFKSTGSVNKFNKSTIFTKEMFLQANCQFLVNNQGDYSIHFKNPDTMVDWCKIEQVLLRSHQQISCPICLYPPIAGRITKCGHIYCYPCILNYLALGDKKWRKCPICFDSIYKDDLKSVRILKIDEYKVGDKISLNLMFKEKSSTLIYPLNLIKFYEIKKPKCLNDLSNLKDYDECKKYLKLQTIDSTYVNEGISNREIMELENELKSGDCEENVKKFINESLSLIEKREKIKEVESTEEIIEEQQPIKENFMKPFAVTVHYKDAFDLTVEETCPMNSQNSDHEMLNVEESGTTEVNSISVISSGDICEEGEEEEIKTRTNSDTKSSYSHFYQAEDGQRIFLNSLNLRCLIHEYSQIENCPLKIEAKIVAIENMFMNDELRKRFRYLAHIPLHSEFQIVELDLKEPIISVATIEKFEQQIRYKAQVRKEKEDRERKNERKILLRMNTFSHGNYIETAGDEDFENAQDYNQAFPNIASTPPSSITIMQSHQQQLSNESVASINDSPTQNQVSFAQKLKIESATNKVEQWPSLVAKSPPNATFNSLQMNFSQSCKANATKQINKASNQLQTQNDSNDENETLTAPTYQLSFMSAIDTAFQNLELSIKEIHANSIKI